MARTPSDNARQRLLQATGEILIESGVSGVTADGIAQRSGVAKTTLYRHFGGVDGLIFAAAGANASTVELPDTGSLRGDLRLVQNHYLKAGRSPVNRSVFGWMIARALQSPEAAAMFRATRAQPKGPTLIALQRAIARGEIPPETDLDLAMHLIQGPLMTKRIVEDADFTEPEREALLEMTMRALVKHPTRDRPD